MVFMSDHFSAHLRGHFTIIKLLWTLSRDGALAPILTWQIYLLNSIAVRQKRFVVCSKIRVLLWYYGVVKGRSDKVLIKAIIASISCGVKFRGCPGSV